MRLFGYLLDKSAADERLIAGPYDEPVFSVGSKKAGCVVLHGIGGTPANIRPVSEELIARGYSVSSPMIAGHGETVRRLSESDAADWVASVEAAYEKLEDAGCESIYAVGLSLGGLLSGVLATEKPLAGVVMICPPVVMQPFLRVSRWLAPLCPFVRHESRRSADEPPDPYRNMFHGMSTKKLADVQRLSRRFRKNIENLRCPLLAIRAGKDNKVSEKTYDLLRTRAKNAASQRFVVFEDSFHGCTYGAEREEIARVVADYIDEIEGNGAP